MEQHEKKPALCVVVKLIALVVYVSCIYVVFIYVLCHFGWMNGFLGVCHTGVLGVCPTGVLGVCPTGVLGVCPTGVLGVCPTGLFWFGWGMGSGDYGK